MRKDNHICTINQLIVLEIKPLSTNLTKWSNTLKQFVGNHFQVLALKGLIAKTRGEFRTLLNLYDRAFSGKQWQNFTSDI